MWKLVDLESRGNMCDAAFIQAFYAGLYFDALRPDWKHNLRVFGTLFVAEQIYDTHRPPRGNTISNETVDLKT